MAACKHGEEEVPLSESSMSGRSRAADGNHEVFREWRTCNASSAALVIARWRQRYRTGLHLSRQSSDPVRPE